MNEIAATLEHLRGAGLYRELRTVDSAQGARVTIGGREVLLMCSNDYLGLAADLRVRGAAADALEHELAEFKGHDACVLFGSGFLANTGVISALAGRGDVILSDALNHASIIEGCRQSRAETIVYEHRDLDALAAGLRRAAGRRTLIVTDSVFSMDGDLAPLEAIVELAGRNGARIIVDEAHATGVVGPGGRGLVAALGLERAVDVVVGTLSKALGSYGAFACCSRPMAAFLVNRARTLIFSTALPPPSVAAAGAALQIIREQPAIVERLRLNARQLRTELAGAGFDVPAGETPIIPLIIGDPHDASALCEAGLRGGVFAQAIRPPTVPEGTSRLRVVAMATHTPDDLQEAAATLGAVRAHIPHTPVSSPR